MDIEPDTTTSIPNIDTLIHCDISKWYNRYRRITFPTEFISLPQEFVEFISSDNLYTGEQTKCFDDWDDSDESEGSDGNDEEFQNTHQTVSTKAFPTIEQKLQECVVKWGNIYPKLNWSSPKVL